VTPEARAILQRLAKAGGNKASDHIKHGELLIQLQMHSERRRGG